MKHLIFIALCLLGTFSILAAGKCDGLKIVNYDSPDTLKIEGETIVFEIGCLDSLLEKNKIDFKSIRLSIGEVSLSQIIPFRLNNDDKDLLKFNLQQSNLTREELIALYKLPSQYCKKASKKLAWLKSEYLSLTIGKESQLIYQTPRTLVLNNQRYWAYSVPRSAAFWAGCLIIFGTMYLLITLNSPLLKDPKSRLAITNSSFSLGLSQFTFWVLIVMVSFIFLSTQFEDVKVLNETAVVFLTISSTTTIVSRSVSNSQMKQDSSPNKQNTVDYRTSFGSFFKDISSDDNGISIHRLQTIFFNIAFALFF
ncbi:hypothetical protein FNH22_24365 [Fulvivirga sp. M361]|uniref:hypothetical protein n=1 Tax=Fulvivirga sp. M361 TaxID=2594266 RepID=UPI00117BD638|nr:hypothetical protein [Fulvivirga sp. M361]TRX51273.1 hypothetical protein FNH22_24365 [Fulvivirga sp. M361]